MQPPHQPGRFTRFRVPDHLQQVVCMMDEHVEGKDVQGQCDKKRKNGQYQERGMTKTEANSPDMKPPPLGEGPE
jgi:hypothetical protein